MNRKTYSSPAVNPEKTGTLNTRNNSGQMALDSGTTFVSDGFVLDRGDIRLLESQKSTCIDAHYHQFPDNHGQRTGIISQSRQEFIKVDINGNPKANQNKASCFTAGAHSGGNHSDMDLIFLNKRHESNYKSADQKANALLATSWKGNQANGMTLTGIARIRRLTPTECARLQTIPAWYRWECSDTQQYRMLGNGWTVDVIAHILSFIEVKQNINVA